MDFDFSDLDMNALGFAVAAFAFLMWWVFAGPWPVSAPLISNIVVVVAGPVVAYVIVHRMTSDL